MRVSGSSTPPAARTQTTTPHQPLRTPNGRPTPWGVIVYADVAVDADVTIDQTTINSGNTLDVQGGVTLAIDDGTGTDLTVTGTLTNSGTVVCAADSTVVYNGPADQTILALDYASLGISGTGTTKTFQDGVTKVDTEIGITDTLTLTGNSADAVTVPGDHTGV